MNETVASQRWGLGAAGVDAQLKGGWGPGNQPGAGGGYLDRQMGVLNIHGKPLCGHHRQPSSRRLARVGHRCPDGHRTVDCRARHRSPHPGATTLLIEPTRFRRVYAESDVARSAISPASAAHERLNCSVPGGVASAQATRAHRWVRARH